MPHMWIFGHNLPLKETLDRKKMSVWFWFFFLRVEG